MPEFNDRIIPDGFTEPTETERERVWADHVFEHGLFPDDPARPICIG